MAIRTPRRAARQKTPYKQRTKEEIKETSLNLTELIKYYKEKEEIREEYIQALKEENEYLRNSNSVNFSELTGLSISRVGNILKCKQAIEKEGKVSSVSFELEKNPDGFVYNFKSSKNLENLPDYLKKEIYFDEDQVKLFFFNVYECIARE